jgi:hypothetical protein
MAAMVLCGGALPLIVLWMTWGRPWTEWPLLIQFYVGLCLVMGLVVVPAATLALRLRRPPRGVSSTASEVPLTAPDQASALIGPGRYNWMLRLPGSASMRLRRVEWNVAMRGLPVACEGLSLLHITDLHFAPCFDRRYFDRIADEAEAMEADLVVFTGDLIDHESGIDWIAPVLSRLRGRLGTYAILGNHDYNFDLTRIRQELEAAGFNDIDGRWTSLEVGGATIALGGTSAPWGPGLDLDGEPGADLRILLSHTPDQFYRASAAGIDLMLAGHNHGGQVRLPLLGPILMPSRYSRRFDRGFFREGRTLMSVCQGIAGKHPLRYGCPPELSRIVLHAVEGSIDDSSAFALPSARAAD